ncbi:replication initiator [Streptomyces sp. IMTB 2501]|uniref:replication initiator n=1 Tax=Streptomyces sp. IMTB 2501 TaxID=1776340 RepID=UPI00267B8BEA
MSADSGNETTRKTRLSAASSAPAERSGALARELRLQALSEADRDLIRLVSDPLYPRWREQIKAIGGCAHPIYLSGSTVTRDAVTGEVISSYSTAGEPGERLAVRCRNRRASVCEPCSRLHAGDTFQLVRAGLSGGKGVPEGVKDRPRLFVTLTAPSFGPVHRVLDGEPCRPRRDDPRCEHGRRLGCGLAHTEDDPLVGLPLCPDCYDYVGHVLWHAHAGRLWDRFTTTVRLDAFGTWGDRGWFFESPRLNDRHPSYDWFLDQFKAAAKLAGTPQYTPKSFRHFFVSEAIHAQIPLFEVAAWVGHRTTRTTELVYGHLVRRAMDRGARTMHNRLGLKLQPFKGLIAPPSLTPSEDDIEDWDDVA